MTIFTVAFQALDATPHCIYVTSHQDLKSSANSVCLYLSPSLPHCPRLSGREGLRAAPTSARFMSGRTTGMREGAEVRENAVGDTGKEKHY
jgi:hypothetical protein